MNTTSFSLLEHVKADHAESWARLVRLYTPLILWWCRRRGLRRGAAENVLQKTFLVVARKIRAFADDGQPGSFRRWLCSITRYKIREERRRIRKEPPAVGGSWDPEDIAVDEDPSDSDEATERCLLVRRALKLIRDQFEPRTWDVVWQVVIEGRYAQDVAKEFGMEVGAVYTAKSRVLSLLRKKYKELRWLYSITGKDPSDFDEASELCLLVRRGLDLIRDQFEPRTWEVVEKVVVEGCYAQDVAEKFGTEVGAVHTARSRVLSRLREEYEGLLT